MLQNFFKKSVNTNKYYIFLVFTLFLTCCAVLLYILWLSLENNSLLLQMVTEGKPLKPLSVYIEEHKNYLSTLNSEELACLFNSLGFLMIYFAFTSIVTVLFGEFIIQKLQLEIRFPRLAKYLKLRQKVNKYYLILNIILVYLIIIIYIYININRILSF